MLRCSKWASVVDYRLRKYRQYGIADIQLGLHNFSDDCGKQTAFSELLSFGLNANEGNAMAMETQWRADDEGTCDAPV